MIEKLFLILVRIALPTQDIFVFLYHQQGFDHVVANQFLIPIGMMFGADISIYHLFFKALVPATLGNIVGGGIFVGAVYWYVFDSMTSSMQLFARIRHGWQKRTKISWHHGPNKADGELGDDQIVIMDEEASKDD